MKKIFRKIGNAFRKYWFFICFAAILAVPLYGWIPDSFIRIKGVTVKSEHVKRSLQTIGDGTYQSSFATRWEEKLPGRKTMLKLRNQILYSVFMESPNTNVVIGKDRYLYEYWYIRDYLQYDGVYSDENMDALIDRLVRFEELAQENGKEVYIYLTPNKTVFESDKIPSRYFLADRRDEFEYTNIEKFSEELQKAGLPFFNAVEYVEEHQNDPEIKASVFNRTGTHWQTAWFNYGAAALQNYIRDNSRFDLAKTGVKETPVDKILDVDVDLYGSLNLFVKAPGPFYDAEMTVEEAGEDKPVLFARGGSFMGVGIRNLGRVAYGESFILENAYYFLDGLENGVFISNWRSYDEVDLDYYLGRADIILLECNAGGVTDMSFGFIDYVLEHPEYLDDSYDIPVQ